MALADIPTEVLHDVFKFCNKVEDALHLGATCRRLRAIIHSSDRLPILYATAEAELGPLTDAIRLATHNASQPVHLPRAAPAKSMAMLETLMNLGRVANKFVEIYPVQKWYSAESSLYRRLLTTREAYRLRRAIYRLWLYTKAFHNSSYRPQERLLAVYVQPRAAYIRFWPANELAEMLDAQEILRSLLAYQICPSNGTAVRRYRARYPNDPMPVLTNTIPTLPSTNLPMARSFASPYDFIHANVNFRKLLSGRKCRSWGMVVGFGDDIGHYYVIEDMLKLAPDQILWLDEHINGEKSKDDGEVELQDISDEGDVVNDLVSAMGAPWFENNGETFGDTLNTVITERGDDADAFKQAVEQGEMGVVRGAYW